MIEKQIPCPTRQFKSISSPGGFPAAAHKMTYSIAISFISLSAIWSVTFCDFTFQNRLLPNNYFRPFFVKDWLQCVEACNDNTNCISYNYGTSSKCQLNKYGFRDRCEASKHLIVSPGHIFQQLRPVSL